MQHQTTSNLSDPRGFSALTINVDKPATRTTLCLSKGTQKTMMDAAKLAAWKGTPINRLLTVRTASMRLSGGGGIMRNGTPAECIRGFLDKEFRWLRVRGQPVANIWSREFSSYWEEHLHFGYYMHPEFDAAHAKQLAKWFDEDIGQNDRNSATIAMSDEHGWNIRGCIRGDTSGQNIAAYLGKAEPNEILTAWGKVKKNKAKPQRNKKGGEGPIEGTAKHDYRWGTSTSLGPQERERSGIFAC